jgi:hypothetical protein
MNTCAHDHETRGEIRRLPIGFTPNYGAIAVCYDHWDAEMRDRAARAKETSRYKWSFPKWAELPIDQPEKDGKTDQVDNAAWNTGSLAADPLDLPANGSINNHVHVPDAYTTPVPEPGTLLLIGTGLDSAGAWSRRRWFGRKSA